ncbi:hypothetical protein GALL_438120 [mine drainage metagenome]|uniref:Uncharacterized protein n=1 Tax=mine drainage metagenome TaxID=410659 RepID=A0A1J5PSG0_9ZZZZ
MVERRQRLRQIGSVGARFDAQRRLPHCGQHVLRIDQGANPRLQPQPLQAGSGQQDAGIPPFVELAQPGVEIAAQRFDAQLRKTRPDLRLPPQAGRAHHRARGHVGQAGMAAAHPGVARILAFHHGSERKPRRQIHRHILQRMHRQIGEALLHCHFEFLDEQPLAADLRQRPVENLVALGGHAENAHLASGIERLQQIAHVLGLPQGKAAFARGDDEGLRRSERGGSHVQILGVHRSLHAAFHFHILKRRFRRTAATQIASRCGRASCFSVWVR